MAPTAYGDISTLCLGTLDTDCGASTPTRSSLSSPSQKMVPSTSHLGHQQVLSMLRPHFPESLTTISPSHQDHCSSLLPTGLPAPATPTTFSMQQPAKALLPVPQLHCCLLKTKLSVFVHRAFAHSCSAYMFAHSCAWPAPTVFFWSWLKCHFFREPPHHYL